MKTAVDTNILFDLFHGGDASVAARDALAAGAASGSLVICPVVYAEVAVAYADPSELDEVLLDLGIHREDFSVAALWEASRTWLAYVRSRTPQVACNRCGATFGVTCPRCASSVPWRQHVIPDFLVGGHALASADRLLTRDAGYFRTYFPTLARMAPA